MGLKWEVQHWCWSEESCDTDQWKKWDQWSRRLPTDSIYHLCNSYDRTASHTHTRTHKCTHTHTLIRPEGVMYVSRTNTFLTHNSKMCSFVGSLSFTVQNLSSLTTEGSFNIHLLRGGMFLCDFTNTALHSRRHMLVVGCSSSCNSGKCFKNILVSGNKWSDDVEQ